MRKACDVNSRGGATLAVIVFLSAFAFSARSASAQSVFCPATVSTTIAGPQSFYKSQFLVPNIMQISGNCTNPKIAGAVSGSALASQTIGDLAGSAANQETSVAVRAIEGRREEPREACPAGEVLTDGICRARPAPVASLAPELAPTLNATQATGLMTATALASPAVSDKSFRIGSWAQGLGAYDHRTGDQISFTNCCTAQPVIGNITPIVLDASSNTTSGGFVGGIDATKRGLWSNQDGVVLGLLGGYTWTRISVGTNTLSTVPSRTASGSSSSSAHVDGPNVGAYVSYFNGSLSNDFLIKDDFLSLSETQSQILGFGSCSCFGPNAPAFVSPQSGSGSTNMNQLTFSDDLSYRAKSFDWGWIEPTAGAVYVNSSYASSAAALGLSDGYTFRLQAGARIGMNSNFGTTRVTTVLTGLLFNDVIVHGNNIQGASFGQNGDILSDQGKVQAQAIASITLDLGHGVSASVQGNVYGGRDIFGAGGQATLRMQW